MVPLTEAAKKPAKHRKTIANATQKIKLKDKNL